MWNSGEGTTLYVLVGYFVLDVDFVSTVNDIAMIVVYRNGWRRASDLFVILLHSSPTIPRLAGYTYSRPCLHLPRHCQQVRFPLESRGSRNTSQLPRC